jgi:hypothetical protein
MVGRYMNVLQTASRLDRLHQLHCLRIDNVEGARGRRDGHEHEPILGHGDVVGMPAQGNFVYDRAALLVHDIQHFVRPFADVNPLSVRREVERLGASPGTE